MYSTLVKFLLLAFIDGGLCQEEWRRQSPTDGSGSEPTTSEFIYTRALSLHASSWNRTQNLMSSTTFGGLLGRA